MTERWEKKANTIAGCVFYGSAVTIGLEAIRSCMYAANYKAIELQAQLQNITLPIGLEERLSDYYHQGLALAITTGFCVAVGTHYLRRKE